MNNTKTYRTRNAHARRPRFSQVLSEPSTERWLTYVVIFRANESDKTHLGFYQNVTRCLLTLNVETLKRELERPVSGPCTVFHRASTITSYSLTSISYVRFASISSDHSPGLRLPIQARVFPFEFRTVRQFRLERPIWLRILIIRTLETCTSCTCLDFYNTADQRSFTKPFLRFFHTIAIHTSTSIPSFCPSPPDSFIPIRTRIRTDLSRLYHFSTLHNPP